MHKFMISTRLITIVVGLLLVITTVQFALSHKTNSSSYPTEISSARQIEKQLACLSKNIYFEAANEPFEGKVAVAQVTLNRVESGNFANTICGVVQQKNIILNKTICQFSWFCENDTKVKPINSNHFKESEEVARMVLLEGMRLPSLKEALYYHADYVNPKWNKPKIAQIGRHIFYKEKTTL